MNTSKKLIRDNVYGDVYVPDFALELIDTPEFQRLRRIKQLGGIDLVYIGAKHTRFEHSVGVLHNLHTIMVQNKTHKFNDKKWKAIMAAGLLHDIGHGPLSHSIEAIFKGVCHERIGKQIILDKTSNIYKVLNKNKIDPKYVIEMFDEKKHPVASQLLSSHVDVDRMDYLLRDAYNTGTNYGFIEREKLINSMVLSGKKLTFKESGISAIESFLFSRYQSFKSIYLHRIGLIQEEMFRLLFKRLNDLRKEEQYKPFVERLSPLMVKFDVKKYLELDDHVFSTIVANLAKTSDPIIKDLASRLYNRDLFGAWKVTKETNLTKLKSKLIKKGFDPKYYLVKATVEKSPYTLKKVKPILIMEKNKKTPTDVIKLSSVIKALSSQKYKETYILHPKV